MRQKHVPLGKKRVKNASPQSKVRPPDPSGRQKRVPSAKKCVKNAYPQPESPPPGPRRASKTRTLSQKVFRKRVPSAKKWVKNSYPQPESPSPQTPAGVKNAYAPPKSASKTRTFRQKSAPVGPLDGNEPPSGTPLPGRVKRWFCSITRVFSCILRHAGSDPVAERGRGEVNLSPILGLTLRPRVGGFCDMLDRTQ